MGFFESIRSYFMGSEYEGPQVRPGRNEPCWCGSGTKYKKCHLDEDDRKGKAGCSSSCGPS